MPKRIDPVEVGELRDRLTKAQRAASLKDSVSAASWLGAVAYSIQQLLDRYNKED